MGYWVVGLLGCWVVGLAGFSQGAAHFDLAEDDDDQGRNHGNDRQVIEGAGERREPDLLEDDHSDHQQDSQDAILHFANAGQRRFIVLMRKKALVQIDKNAILQEDFGLVQLKSRIKISQVVFTA